jgi:O-antigen ligase
MLFFTHFYIPIVEPVQNALFAAASEDKTVLGQLIGVGVWFIAGTLMLSHYRRIFSGLRAIAYTGIFAGFALLSAMWSQDAGVTLRKSIFLLLTTAFGIYLARRYPVERQLRIICLSGCMITLLSIFFALFLPRYGLDHDVHEGVWVGVFTQKNVCAREMLFILVCLVPYVPGTQAMRWVRRVAIAGSLTVIAGTRSKTALLMTAMVLGFFPTLRMIRRMSPSLTLTMITAFAVTVSGVLAVALSAAPKFILLLGRDSTMTGRTDIWQAVMQAILKRPLLGYGFAAFWLSLRGESANVILALRWAVPAAHNGFLEIWLQLGAFGLLLFGWGFLQGGMAALRGLRQPQFQQAAWPLAVLLLTLVYNLDESSLMQANDFLWVLYVATLVNIATHRMAAVPSRTEFLSLVPEAA